MPIPSPIAPEATQEYRNPPATPGSYPQLVPFYWYRRALIDLKKEQYFGQLADTLSMP